MAAEATTLTTETPVRKSTRSLESLWDVFPEYTKKLLGTIPLRNDYAIIYP